MSQTSRSGIERFQLVLDNYRTILEQNKPQLEADSWLKQKITFWIESIRFLITELEIWDYLGHHTKYAETANKLEAVMDHLNELIVDLIEED